MLEVGSQTGGYEGRKVDSYLEVKSLLFSLYCFR